MAKFKVGDVVHIKDVKTLVGDNPDGVCDRGIWCKRDGVPLLMFRWDMVRYCGKEATVVTVYQTSDSYDLSFDGVVTHDCVFCDSMFVEQERPQYYNGKVVCIERKDGLSLKVGKVYDITDGNLKVGCDPKYAERILSVDELNNRHPEYRKFAPLSFDFPPIFFSGRVVCIRSNTPYYKVGTVYQVDNGKMWVSEIDSFIHNIKNIEELNRRYSGIDFALYDED